MKKIKSLLLACMAALMMFVIPLAAACDTNGSSTSQPDTVLESIQLNLDNVQLGYVVKDQFNSNGLVVTGTFSNKDGSSETRDVTEYSSVDSSAFNSNEAGQYTINVNCTVDSVTKSSSYVVSVIKEPREGILVTHSDGSLSKTLEINASKPTVDIDPTDIIVKMVEYGQVSKTITDYTLEVYKEAEKITTYTDLGSGTYQIWVSKQSANYPTFTCENFVLIYVVESVSGFKFIGGEDQLQTQNIGIDVISQTWKFQVTHASSSTPVILTAKDVIISPLEVLEPGNNKYATVTYVYYNAKGEKTELSTQVKYNVVKGENQVVDTNSFDWSKINELGYDDSTTLTQADFTGTNGFLTKLPAGIITYRNKTPGGADDCIQIRGDALRVSFNGVGTLAVSARSTGSANLSSIGVKKDLGDNQYEYLAGKFTSTDVQELEYVEGLMYQVTGSGFSQITFTIAEPGDYIIFTVDNNPEGDAIYNRDTRVNSIIVNDVYDMNSEATISFDDSVVMSVGKIGGISLYNNGSKD